MDGTGAPCGACGQLPPLKPIQRSSNQCQRPWLQPNQSQQHKVSQTEPGSPTSSHNESLGDVEMHSRPSSSNSDVEQPSCNKKRSYDSVLEEIETIFAGYKVKRATIASYMDLCQRRRDRKAKRHERSPRATNSRSRSPTATCSPTSPPHLREPICSRDVEQLPSPCSFDPLRISPSPSHHRGEHSKRKPQATRFSSPSRRPRPDHEADDNHHQEACRSNRVDHYHDVLRLYEECHIHEIDERITTATLITSPRTHRYEERGFQTHEPRQILYQHVCQQTVVRHHEGCHLQQRAPTGHRCGSCTQQDRSAEDQCNTGHYQRIGESSNQEVTAMNLCRPDKHREGTACENLQSPKCNDYERAHNNLGCHLHGQESADPVKWTPRGVRDPSEWTPGGVRDPLEWTPRAVRKAKKSCAVHWLDKVTASQHIPSDIVRQYLRGKRRCSPRWRKQNCHGCAPVGKKVDPCAKPATYCWDSGSVVTSPVVECKEWTQSRGKLSRLALSRVLIVKPVPKVSTSLALWSRKEFDMCSECKDLKMFQRVNNKSGRWPSILETMLLTSSLSSSSLCIACQQQHDEMASNCSTKYSCHTVHGLSVPGGRTADLQGPELNSAIRLRRKLHKLHTATFDRRAAMEVAQMEGIGLDKEVLELLPDHDHDAAKTSSQKASSRRAHTVRRQNRWEMYSGLSKIVELTMPNCQQCALARECGVQVYKRNSPRVGSLWNSSDICPEVQSGCPPSIPHATSHCFNWPRQVHGQNCRAPDQVLDEQHWEYQVEAWRCHSSCLRPSASAPVCREHSPRSPKGCSTCTCTTR